MRLNPTMGPIKRATTQAATRTAADRKCQPMMMARQNAKAVAAAVCPEGNDDVGGETSSCSTGGRDEESPTW